MKKFALLIIIILIISGGAFAYYKVFRQKEEPKIMEIVKKIKVTSDPELKKQDVRGMDMEVRTKQGAVYRKSIDIPPGSPGNELTKEEHIARFRDCVSYGGKPLPKKNPEKIISMVDRIEETKDIRDLISLLQS